MIQKIETRNKLVVFIFFASLFLLGVTIYKDYGVHWDEYNNQDFGNKWATYVSTVIRGDSPGRFQLPGLKEHDWIHGPVFEMFLAFMQKALKLGDSRDVIFMRHLCTFLLFFAGVWFFYLLCAALFKSRRVSLLGSLFLIVSPRIFADSFYNSVDMSFFSFYILGMYTLLRLLERKTFPAVFIHACVCALLVDIKFIGITVPLYTVVFLTFDMIVNAVPRERVRGTTALVFFMAVFVSLCILFWPLVWTDPFPRLKIAVALMNHYRWPLTYLYFGKYLTVKGQPWHYAPVWITITTPAVYIIFFSAGFLFVLTSFFKKKILPAFSRRNSLLCMVWFLVPLAAGRGRFYDGWRHIYFIYPALLIFTLAGLTVLWEFVTVKFPGRVCKGMHSLMILFIVAGIAPVVYFMVRYHPYQNVYFNRLAGTSMTEIKKNFELDYWRLSFRKALEFIVRHDTDKDIKVFAAGYLAGYSGIISAQILPPDDRARLVFVGNPRDAKYFLSDYRWYGEEYPFKDECFSTDIAGAKIMVVYRLHNE